MWYDLYKFSKEIIDVSVDASFNDGELDIEVHLKIPIASEIEHMYRRLTDEDTTKEKPDG